MRGKLLLCNCKSIPYRITTADAGKTRMAELYEREQEDHPRGCGENSTTCDKLTFPAGSPPRMRGKLGYCVSVDSAVRITPADAGKTVDRGEYVSSVEDHPRGCGENGKS